MTIHNRLKLVGLVPIILLMLLSSYFFITSYTHYENGNTLKRSLTNNAKISRLLSDVGQERGLTAMHIASENEDFLDPLTKQREQTNSMLNTVKNNLISEHIVYLPFLLNLLEEDKEFQQQDYTKLLTQVQKLPLIRKNADTPSTTFDDMFLNNYTQKLSTPILNSLLEINYFDLNTEIGSLISTLSKFYIAKENADLERGFITHHIMKQSPMSFKDIIFWNKIKTNAALSDFKYIQNAEVVQQLNTLFKTPSTEKLLQELTEVSSAIQTETGSGDYNEDAMNWVELQTKKISLLNKGELILSNILWKKTDKYIQKRLLILALSALFLLLSIILAYLVFSIIQDITRNIKVLEDVLNKAVESMQDNEDHLPSDALNIENINLNTYAGTYEAYKFVDSLIEVAKEDKSIALRANKAKSLFLANMSHEIRTPLNGIVGFTEILRSTKLTAEQDEFLAIIDKSSENLLNIINNILDLSKIESNKVEIENIVFNASEEFESAVETYAVAAAEKNIDLNYYMDPTISNKLKGDPTKIKEIILNLLSNAIKFTNHDGEVNLVIMKTHVENDLNPRISFSIQDNGIGMTKEQQLNIFDPFAQADVSVTRNYGGTGLGLTISSQFVELMGGDLILKSEQGQGTTFLFDLPLEEISSNEVNYANSFKNITIAKYSHETPTKLDTYLEDYFKYFGLPINHFQSIETLQELLKADTSQIYWIDIDKTNQNILDNLGTIDKDKLIIIANITSRSKIESLGINQDNVIYKPITLTKLNVLLAKTDSVIPQLVENTLPTYSTRFDAHILVTEDNIINQKLIKRILEEHSISVDLAINGVEALKKRQANQYDLIFMDIQMPLMDGIEATHKILEYEKAEEISHVPIVALTANALKGDRERFLKEGMDEYITKPVETSQLLLTLNKFLSHKSITTSSEVKDSDLEVKEHEIAKLASETPLGNSIENDYDNIPLINEENSTDIILEEDMTLDLNDSFVENIDIPKKSKQILIAKKFLLERRILMKVLENLGYLYTSIEQMDTLENTILSEDYDIIFTDTTLLKNTFIDNHSHLKVVTDKKSKNEILKLIQNERE